MTATISQARDDILTLFKDAWDAGVESAGVEVIYQDSPNDLPTANSVNGNPLPWARATVMHTGGGQSSLAGDSGTRRWRRSGLVTIQIFTPGGTGLSLADSLAMIALGAFEGRSTPSQIWFRNCRATEIGPDGIWFQTNVVSEFIYDEVR